MQRHALSPYLGSTFRGSVERTIRRGETIFAAGQITARTRRQVRETFLELKHLCIIWDRRAALTEPITFSRPPIHSFARRCRECKRRRRSFMRRQPRAHGSRNIPSSLRREACCRPPRRNDSCTCSKAMCRSTGPFCRLAIMHIPPAERAANRFREDRRASRNHRKSLISHCPASRHRHVSPDAKATSPPRRLWATMRSKFAL